VSDSNCCGLNFEPRLAKICLRMVTPSPAPRSLSRGNDFRSFDGGDYSCRDSDAAVDIVVVSDGSGVFVGGERTQL
jgi:hypothetical protein